MEKWQLDASTLDRGAAAVVASCSWCHTRNQLRDGATTCASCSHRADLPRVLCDCPTCSAPRVSDCRRI